jgi:hypothetical protein
MINPTAKMRRLGVAKITYGRDIVVYPDSKLTDRGMLRFHALPTTCVITVYYTNGDIERMSKCAFEILANEVKFDRFINKHFVD